MNQIFYGNLQFVNLSEVGNLSSGDAAMKRRFSVGVGGVESAAGLEKALETGEVAVAVVVVALGGVVKSRSTVSVQRIRLCIMPCINGTVYIRCSVYRAVNEK